MIFFVKTHRLITLPTHSTAGALAEGYPPLYGRLMAGIHGRRTLVQQLPLAALPRQAALMKERQGATEDPGGHPS
ncbi:MAG: hypothetical protein AAF196_20880 [Planctomycetota bacterium]